MASGHSILTIFRDEEFVSSAAVKRAHTAGETGSNECSKILQAPLTSMEMNMIWPYPTPLLGHRVYMVASLYKGQSKRRRNDYRYRYVSSSGYG